MTKSSKNNDVDKHRHKWTFANYNLFTERYFGGGLIHRSTWICICGAWKRVEHKDRQNEDNL